MCGTMVQTCEERKKRKKVVAQVRDPEAPAPPHSRSSPEAKRRKTRAEERLAPSYATTTAQHKCDVLDLVRQLGGVGDTVAYLLKNSIQYKGQAYPSVYKKVTRWVKDAAGIRARASKKSSCKSSNSGKARGNAEAEGYLWETIVARRANNIPVTPSQCKALETVRKMVQRQAGQGP
eukprot:TRINITY_DN1473_c0_g1_i3.p1 TRINITY_DN1473_c0_g1~~TRINITY_DN1473_c0_g1_i3.p1  ORF type:complete len:177 (+),score=0.25 TRINITY_DN1473_c0_g1_i3:362-892(+)